MSDFAFDTNHDGFYEGHAYDTNGDGSPDVIALDTNLDGTLDTYGYDTNGDGHFDTFGVDRNEDGQFDEKYTDPDVTGSAGGSGSGDFSAAGGQAGWLQQVDGSGPLVTNSDAAQAAWFPAATDASIAGTTLAPNPEG